MTKTDLINTVAKEVEGTFEVQKRAARQGRNPQDPKKVIEIPAKNVPVFRAGKALKEAVNEKK